MHVGVIKIWYYPCDNQMQYYETLECDPIDGFGYNAVIAQRFDYGMITFNISPQYDDENEYICIDKDEAFQIIKNEILGFIESERNSMIRKYDSMTNCVKNIKYTDYIKSID